MTRAPSPTSLTRALLVKPADEGLITLGRGRITVLDQERLRGLSGS